MSPRAERVADLGEAAALVRDGMVVGLSGFSYQNPPMAIVREIIRRGVKDLTVVSGPTSGLETDLLIGVQFCIALAFGQRRIWQRIERVKPSSSVLIGGRRAYPHVFKNHPDALLTIHNLKNRRIKIIVLLPLSFQNSAV